jgi:thymidine phosphorylase
MILGAGRDRAESSIDPAVGLIFEKKVGDPVCAGERICALYSNDRSRVHRALQMIRAAIRFSPDPVSLPPLVLDRVP